MIAKAPLANKSKFRKSIFWLLAIILLLALLVFIGLAWREIQTAKSGKDLGATYRTYHAGLLGKLKIAGCAIDIKQPWMPRLDSYDDLKIKAPEIIFVNTEQKTVSGEPTNFSVIRRSDEMSKSRFGDPELINSMRASCKTLRM